MILLDHAGTQEGGSAVADHQDFNQKIINEFRAKGGKVGGYFENSTLLLLHHTGAKSGTGRVNPLAYQPVGDSFAVFGSAAGGPRNPSWYYNLVAHPDTTVEVGTRTLKVRARVASPDERASIFARQMEIAPGFADYEKTAAPREIPVVLLEPRA
jgi:deazaflavin-dependent oxidoreductase (nitroreductase family)